MSKAIIVPFSTILIFFCAWDAGSESNLPTKSALITRFNQNDLAINNGDGHSQSTNDDGLLAWAESQFLEAYIDMFEATKDLKYLDRFVVHADRIVANTDKALSKVDYKGRSRVGWSATAYSFNKARIVFLVHTGMVTYPLVKFRCILKDRYVPVKYVEKAGYYSQVAIDALAEFNSNWVTVEGGTEGFYQFDSDEPQTGNTPDPPMPLPFNNQLAAGKALVLLCTLTGEKLFCEKASRLAAHFKRHLRIDPKGAYVWDYWYAKGLKRYDSVEDFSHGSIDVDFAVQAKRNCMVFEKQDIEGFIKTWIKNVYANGRLASTVDGRGETKHGIALPASWFELAEYDCTIWSDAIMRLDSPGVVNIFGIAKLAKYYDHCTTGQKMESKGGQGYR